MTILDVRPVTGLPASAALRRERSGRLSGIVGVLALVALLIATVSAAGVHGPTAPWAAVPDPAGVVTLLDDTQARALPATAPAVTTLLLDAPAGGVALSLPLRPGELFFGMGERFGSPVLNGRLLHNRSDDGMGADTGASYAPAPFLLSSRGYGLQWDGAADASVDLRAPGAVTIRVAADHVVVHVLTGPGPGAVLSARSALVGRSPVAPPWGLGVWKSLIGGPDRVLADLDRLRAAGVPVDAVWIYDAVDAASGFGWWWPIYGPVGLGTYADPRALVAALHARGVRALGYLSPFVVPGRPGYDEAAALGYLVRGPDGTVHTEPWMLADRRAYIDFTNPAATVWWQDRVRHAIAVLGFDGAMQDYGESAPIDGRYANGMPGTVARNVYPVLYASAARQAVAPMRDTVLFARSGYDGTQAQVTGRFTGDQTRDWDPATGLPAVLAGMMNGSVSGWPYWGPDIAGFYDGADGTTGRDRELWSRWVQLGAFSPVMRDMLGAQRDPLGVQTDDETVALFRAYALLHHALVPLLTRLAVEAHDTGLPLMRPVWLVDPTSPSAWSVGDEYLLGTDVLVAPVLAPGVAARSVYVPPGVWRAYWTGGSVTGPGWTTVDAPRDRIPLFVRVGSDVVLPPPTTLGLPSPTGA